MVEWSCGELSCRELAMVGRPILCYQGAIGRKALKIQRCTLKES